MGERVLLLMIVLVAGCTDPGGGEAALQGARAGAVVTPLDVPPGPDSTRPSSDHWAAGLYQLVLDVHGQQATGLLAVPTGTPTALAVVAHGWGSDATMHRPDLEALADQGAVAVAMDYRGEQRAYKVDTGLEDTVGAVRFLQDTYPEVDLMVLYGWSMGGEVVLMAAQTLPAGTLDYVFAGAAVSDLERTWQANPVARPAIEAATGGTPTEVPDEYARRSPVLHAQEIAAAGLARVFLVHAAGDVAVPVEESERMFEALAEARQPVSFYIVTKDRVPGPCAPPLPCVPGLVLPAGHQAGEYRLMRPFIEHRIERLPDPAEPSVRGTYDGDTGEYDPSDVGP